MLTVGNVSDVKAAPALLERAGPMRYLLGDKATMRTPCVFHCGRGGPYRSFLDGATARHPSVTIRPDIGNAT